LETQQHIQSIKLYGSGTLITLVSELWMMA